MPLLKKVSGAAAAAAAASGAAVVLWGQRITVVVPLPSRPPLRPFRPPALKTCSQETVQGQTRALSADRLVMNV